MKSESGEGQSLRGTTGRMKTPKAITMKHDKLKLGAQLGTKCSAKYCDLEVLQKTASSSVSGTECVCVSHSRVQSGESRSISNMSFKKKARQLLQERIAWLLEAFSGRTMH